MAAATHDPQHVAYLLRLGDSSLVLGQRLSEWCGHGPVLEEDIALANIALDLIGQSRLLLSHAATLEGTGRDEDALAYFRTAREYRNFTLCELPNSGIEKGANARDYGFTLMRNLLFFAWQLGAWRGLTNSADTELAAIAAKSLKETTYHLKHAADWVIRLGDGTAESNARMQRALDSLWPYTRELFAEDEIDAAMIAKSIGVSASSLHTDWRSRLTRLLDEATLRIPADAGFMSEGRSGIHSEHLDFLLAEMQSVARAHPGARW
jgi:ring-1,2-phenylacetyl-CoA epoxidase subunit PaaC